MGVYDISEAFERIEDELIGSMMRNFSRHRIEEIQQGFEWEQWQVLQLQALEKYRRDNQKKFPARFNKLNGQIADALNTSYQDGAASQERQILKAVQKGYSPPVKLFSEQTEVTGEFFKVNDKRLDALITATTSDMSKAEYSILRQADDQYRKIIFNAQVYANTGAGTYEKAVDMATKDFLKAGINSIEYKDGSRHSIEEYSRMALQTGMKRAYLQGEGEKRKEFGIPTVILKKRTCACPKCLPFVGKTFIDDVWSGGDSSGISPVTGIKYPLLSQAIALGLYHPNCRDTHSTYYEGISTPPEDSVYTVDELDEIAERYKAEQKRNYCENQAERYNRLSKYSLDSGNKRMYGARAKVWEDKAGQYKNFIESVENRQKGGIIEINRALLFRDIDNAMEYAADQLSLSANAISKLPLEKVTAILSNIRQLYREIPTLDGFIDDIVLVDMNEIAKATLSWSGDKPRILLKLSKDMLNSMSLSEINTFVDECVKGNVFSSKKGLYGIFKHEFGHFGEYKQTLKKCNYSASEVSISLDRYELAKEIKDLALKNCDIEPTVENIKRFLSIYASENPAEFVAEAYSSNDDNVLVKEVKRLVKRKWGI